jgi:D-threo-aldose 1-dehydrogenase
MDPLSKMRLGRTKLHVTRLGVGGAALGGLFEDPTEEDASKTVHRALELGVNLFDTAPLYGAGKSESRIGRALARMSRASFVLSTKTGYCLVSEELGAENIYFPFKNPPALRPIVDFSYEGAMRSIEESFRRLGVDRLDIVHIHDPEGHIEQAMNGAYAALHKLRDQGVIQAIGVGTNHAESIVELIREGNFDCVLLAGRYTLIEHIALQQALPLCMEQEVSVIIGGPYNSGILATGAIPGASYNYHPADQNILEQVRRIENVCTKHKVALKAAALQFPLAHPAVASIIPGARTAGEVEENFNLISQEIPQAFWAEMRRQGLLPAEAPVPESR